MKRAALPIALESVERVTFYKRDELTTDLICCEIVSDQQMWIFHEELPDWDALIEGLSTLPGFKGDWYDQVSKPPFAASRFIAYEFGNADFTG